VTASRDLSPLLAQLRERPDTFTDDELAELAALAREVSQAATHAFVERLLARSRAEDGR